MPNKIQMHRNVLGNNKPPTEHKHIIIDYNTQIHTVPRILYLHIHNENTTDKWRNKTIGPLRKNPLHSTKSH